MGFSIANAAMDQMTRTMALALAPHHIRVNAIAFGSVMSASLKQALKDTDGLREDITKHDWSGDDHRRRPDAAGPSRDRSALAQSSTPQRSVGSKHAREYLQR